MRRALDAVDDVGADHPLRRAVERGGDDGVEHRGREVALPSPRRARGSPAVSRKRVPMAMPSAPQASAATRPRPSWKPAGAEHRDLGPDGVDDLRAAAATWAPCRCGRRPRRPGR